MRSSLSNASRTRRSSQLSESKWIVVYINGDEFHQGVKCMVNQKHTKTFLALLNYLTDKLQPKFGVVRALYDGLSGRKINSLSELIHNHKYAAAGTESFKSIDKWFGETSSSSQRRMVRHQNNKNLSGPKSVRKNLSKSSKEIFLYKNGEPNNPAEKFTLSSGDLFSWDKLLQKISHTIMPEVIYINQLCSLNGQVLSSSEDLSNGGTYVAVGNFETFRRRPYLAVGRSEPILNLQKTLQRSTEAASSIEDGQTEDWLRSSLSNYSRTTTTAASRVRWSRESSRKLLDTRDSSRRVTDTAGSWRWETGDHFHYYPHGVTPPPSYAVASRVVEAVGSNPLKVFASAYYENPYRSKIHFQEPVRARIKLEADPDDVYHARTQNEMTQQAQEVQESSETLIEGLPEEVEESETPEVPEEIVVPCSTEPPRDIPTRQSTVA